jgi:hypothetical protein
MDLFRGDTFMKKIVSSYQFRKGDKFRVAIMYNAYSKEKLYGKEFEVVSENDDIILEIAPEETSKFPIGELLLELEMTTIDGIVKTDQFMLNVKADGINERD